MGWPGFGERLPSTWLWAVVLASAGLLLIFAGDAGAQARSAQIDVEAIEEELSRSQGVERLEPLIELTRHYNRSSPSTALDYAHQALAILDVHKDLAARARVTHQMCWAFQSLGDYGSALIWCGSSATHAEEAGDQNGLARALNTTGVVYWRLADYDRAMDYLLRALRLEEEHGTPLSQSRALTNIGIVQAAMGQLDDALAYYDQSLAVKEEAGDKYGIANVLNNMADVYQLSGRLDEALELHRRSLSLKEELGYDVGAVTSHMQIGAIHAAREESELAAESFKTALQLAESTGDRLHMSAILMHLGVLDRQAGLLELAEEKLIRALKLSWEIDARNQIASISLELAQTYELLGDHEAALAHYKRYHLEQEEVFSAESRDQVAKLEARYEAEGRAAEQERQLLVRNGLIAGLVILALLLVAALGGYRLKAQANRVTRETNARLEAVHRIVTSINSEVELERVLESILNEVMALDAVNRASFLVRDPIQHRFQVMVAQGGRALELLSFGMQEAHVEELFVAEALEEAPHLWGRRGAISSQLAEVAGPFVRARSLFALTVPIEGRIEAVLVLENESSDTAFSADEIDLLKSLQEHVRSAFLRSRLLRELQELNSKKSEVIRVAAHDFRNPVGALMGNMELLALGLRSGSVGATEAAGKLDELQTVGRKTIHALERLLDLSAIESGKGIGELAPHDLTEIIEEYLPPHRHAADMKGIELAVNNLDPLPLVLADAERIGQVLNNLLSNAIKYTHPGGKISIWCESQPRAVVTHIRDTGQGLASGDLNRIFGSFCTLSATPTGGETSTGLGLAIVKGIVDYHGGDIWVESDEGSGSCFSFSLPAA